MKITLRGSRGSLPALGPETARYGGNTSCVEVRGADGSLLVLDAGTGINRIGAHLDPSTKRMDILLTHLHMDHIMGLSYFNPLYASDLELNIWAPPSRGERLYERLIRYFSPPLFPMRLRDLPLSVTFNHVPRGSFSIGRIEIASDLICHRGPTAGYRITEGSRSVAYLPDHEPALGVDDFPQEPDWTSGYDLAEGADLLIHDAQYSAEEYPEHVGWGHSSISHALSFAAMAKVGKLVTFHHDPSHSDDQIDDYMAEAGKDPLTFELVAGAEGDSFEIGV